MTLQELAQMCRDIRYQGRPCVTLNTSYNPRAQPEGATHPMQGPLPEGYVYLSVFINVIDVDTDTPQQVETGQLVHLNDIAGTTHDSYLTYILDLVLMLQHHEVRETFSYQGKRPFDPHWAPGLYITKTPVKLEVA